MKTKFYILITLVCALSQSSFAMLRQRTAQTVKSSSIKVEKQKTEKEYQELLKAALSKYAAQDYQTAVSLFKEVLESPCNCMREQAQKFLGFIYFYGAGDIAPDNRTATYYLHLITKRD